MKNEIIEPYFFTTSTTKLVLMCICTFGFYQLYWFYKNWVIIKNPTGQNIMPFWRALFSIFWCYSCFKHIKNFGEKNNIVTRLPVGFLTLIYILTPLMVHLLGLPSLLGTLNFLTLIPVNSFALKINTSLIPNFQNNFSKWNFVGFICVNIFMLLYIFICVIYIIGIFL